jgi:NAD(P)-dependent dehydrogenase (short-subunit alcohol dehydrogenase family)
MRRLRSGGRRRAVGTPRGLRPPGDHDQHRRHGVDDRRDTHARRPRAVRQPLLAHLGLLHAEPRHIAPEGSIVFTSGSSGRRPQVGLGIYGTLHAALNGLALAAAIELAPLRVNAISPGGIGIGRTGQLIPHPGQARDFGAMALALMVNPAVTGVVVDVDGGEFLGRSATDERRDQPAPQWTPRSAEADGRAQAVKFKPQSSWPATHDGNGGAAGPG